jgi:uncharacterized protein
MNMLVKKINMLFFYMAVAMAALGQQGGKQPKKDKQAPAAAVNRHLDNTLLWKISGNGLAKPSYLFGTMHIVCSNDANLSDSLKQVIKNSQEIYFELDMDNMNEMMGALKYLRMNDNTKLSELLTKEEYEKVDAYFKAHATPLPTMMLYRLKPYFISSMIGEQMMECSAKNGMEMLIMNESKRYNKEIKGLETMEFQASIFDSIPYAKQAKDLVSYIDSIDTYKKMTLDLVEVYRTQNLDGVEQLMAKSDVGMGEYMDLLLFGRNRHWVQQMPEIMKQRSVLFAVGAGHLPGEQGVINLLRKKGYKVTPMNNTVPTPGGAVAAR